MNDYLAAMVPAKRSGWGRIALTGPLALWTTLGGCARSPTPTSRPVAPRIDSVAVSPVLPSMPRAAGGLQVRVVYPAPGALVSVRDSSFLFGSLGTADARLSINGQPVRVWPNGAWLAWVAFPPDSLMQFRIEARTATDSAVLIHQLRRAGGVVRPLGSGLWIDTSSLRPRGRVWLPAGEYLRISLRAAGGAEARLVLPDRSVVPLKAELQPEEIPAAVRAFERDTAKLEAPLRADRYAGILRGRAVGPPPGHPLISDSVAGIMATAPGGCPGCPVGALGIFPDSAWPRLELIRGLDTVRSVWPLQVALLDTVPLVVELDDDTLGTGDTDGLTAGRAAPGGTYQWFLPTGTRALVSGRVNGEIRLRLSSNSQAWIAAAEARWIPAALPVVGRIGSVTATPYADRVGIRVPVGGRVPFRVEEGQRTLTLRLYGAVGDVNWIRYPPADSLVQAIAWSQPSADEITLTMELARPVWGYRTRWDQNDLILEIRRPPRIDPAAPLRGRVIAIDPGHPPGGANGPTGLREAEANLAVGLRLRGLLEASGARVVMTRATDSALDLWPRVRVAESAGADILVSIHNNAVPDGINPLVNSGTSVYYNHPRSARLALEIQRALVRRLALRDLGISRGDLALARPTWMPAVLCEGMFIIMPDQEAALRSPAGQALYAEGVHEGIRRFLERRARGGGG